MEILADESGVTKRPQNLCERQVAERRLKNLPGCSARERGQNDYFAGGFVVRQAFADEMLQSLFLERDAVVRGDVCDRLFSFAKVRFSNDCGFFDTWKL